jgi:acetyl esterase/lipase
MKLITILTSLIIAFTLAACSNNGSQPSADEQPSSTKNNTVESELKTESSEQTAPVGAMSNTVATFTPDPKQEQTIYLWQEGNMPSVTEYTENTGNYADDPEFRPNLISVPVSSRTDIKGAVLINSGGGFQFRVNQNDGFPVAEELSALGYQSFVVNYRLRPYTQEEGALDLARAVRFVRANAEEYGIEENDIAVLGFSAGGILSGEMLLNFDGNVNGTTLVPDYVPDELDQVSADASAAGMIYSFYGRLSVASTDVEKFRASDLPPTYFSYGTEDPLVGEFEENIEALLQADVPVESYVLEGMPHGYGSDGGWISHYDRWLTEIFQEM